MTKEKDPIGELNGGWSRMFKLSLVLIPLAVIWLGGMTAGHATQETQIKHLKEKDQHIDRTVHEIDEKLELLLKITTRLETLYEQDSRKE